MLLRWGEIASIEDAAYDDPQALGRVWYLNIRAHDGKSYGLQAHCFGRRGGPTGGDLRRIELFAARMGLEVQLTGLAWPW
jgi:hypothetical protein